MAKRTFLSESELEQAKIRCRAPRWKIAKGDQFTLTEPIEDYAKWLARILEDRFTQIPGWLDSQPVALGSWARGELSSSSDIDLIFCGPLDVVKSVVDEIQSLGFRLRYRVPENADDWTVGVEPFDVLAILQAHAFESHGAEKLQRQQKLIFSRGSKFKSKLLSAMRSERKDRSKRYDSISNFLEPNIKFGPGGLRDIQQILTVAELFPEKFAKSQWAIERVKNFKNLLLSVRQKLHLLSGQDILTGQDQHEIARWFEFRDARDFMRHLQKGLEQVNFYANWAVQYASLSEAARRKLDDTPIESLQQAFRVLKKDSTVLRQAQVRQFVELRPGRKMAPQLLGRILQKNFRITEPVEFLESLLSSRLLHACLEDLQRVSGLSQHDHYHRFTVDEHTKQAIRKVRLFFAASKKLGRLKEFVKDWKETDWNILLWTSLYHDLGKGLEGDHSSDGAAIVSKQFQRFQFSQGLTEEVAWLVKNHLILSTAAFRLNPRAPSTWKRLNDLDVKGERLLRLAVFTAIDIQATNPEAWNEWKEKLLFGLVKALQTPSAVSFMDLLELAKKKRVDIPLEYLKEMDPVVLESIPAKVIFEDFLLIQKSKKDLPLKVLRNKKGEIWVRFHRIQDEPGLFYHFVQWLFASGCRVQQSAVRTMEPWGVYDWFHVKTPRTISALQKQLEVLQKKGEPAFVAATFESIEVLSEDESGIVLSFKGRDKKGLLVSAARALFHLKAEITWAKVHTWGRQIEDIFCVKSVLSSEELLRGLKSQLLENGKSEREPS